MRCEVNSSTNDVNWRDAIALLSILAIWICVLWNAFDPARSFSLHMDNEFFTGAVLSAISHSFAVGEWPLRMSTALGGVPIYNFSQLSPFYPFYFAPLPLFETPLNAVTAMHWITVLHILLFAVNMYILLRVIGTSRLAAITGGALVAFGANSLAYAAWIQIVAPYSWLPLYLAGLIGVLENRPSRKYPAMAVGGMVLLTLASPSQPLIHAVLLTCVLALFRWWYNHANAKPNAIRTSIIKLFGIAIVAFLISAPAVLPAFVEFREMIRWIGPYPPVVGFDRIPFEAFLIDQLSVAELGGILVKITPQAVGSQFAGPVVVTLAVLALFSSARSWITIAMMAITVYALVSSTGSNLGLAYVNYELPLVNKIREPSRFLILFQLGIGILAALGIDELRSIVSDKQTAPAWKRRVTFIAAIAMFSLVAVFSLRDQGTVLAPAFVASGLLLALVPITVLAARSKWRMRGEGAALCWSAAALAVLSINVTWTPPPITASHYLNNNGVALDMAIMHVAQLDPRHEYRLVFEGSIDKQMASMLASYRRVRTLNSYFNPAPLLQFQELYHHAPRTDNYLQILGSRFLLCRDCTGVDYRGFKFRETIFGYDLHEAIDALPYSQIVQRVNGHFENLNDFITKASSNDLGKGLLFVEKGSTLTFEENSETVADCILHEEIRKPQLIRYLVSCSGPSVLILNEFYTSPWSVTVNGAPSETLRVNGNQIGVRLDQGAQQVEFKYQPRIYLLSIALFVFGVVMALLWVSWPRRAEQH